MFNKPCFLFSLLSAQSIKQFIDLLLPQIISIREFSKPSGIFASGKQQVGRLECQFLIDAIKQLLSRQFGYQLQHLDLCFILYIFQELQYLVFRIKNYFWGTRFNLATIAKMRSVSFSKIDHLFCSLLYNRNNNKFVGIFAIKKKWN